MKLSLAIIWQYTRTACIPLVLLAAAGSGWLIYRQPVTAGPKTDMESSGSIKTAATRLIRLSNNTLSLPDGFVERVGLRFGVISASTKKRSLPPFQGCLAQDSDRQVRVHSRFTGEVVALGTVKNDELHSPGDNSTAPLRTIQYLDRVKKGDLLAVVWSKDLGEKKSELVDAISRMKTDQETLKQLQSLQQEGAASLRSLREAQRNLDADRIAVERVERTLRSWRLGDAEIEAIRAEAERIRRANPILADLTSSEQANWARVEVRAPQDGVILEKTVSVGDIVDTNLDLFKIGDLSSLKVWAHVYEEDLPLLSALPKPIPWNINLPSLPGRNFQGTLQTIGAVIDPNQHTALVIGRVDNPDGQLRIGQYVTVTVDVAPKDGELEVPTEAVVEDGNQSFLFVQAKDNEKLLFRKTVSVIRRCKEVITLRADSAQIMPGDRVVTSGALLIKDAMDEQPDPASASPVQTPAKP